MHRQQVPHGPSQHGFTLVEVVMVIVVVGVLALVAIPRFASRSVYDVSGFAEDSRSILRFAQKTAIGEHLNVSVNLDATNQKLTVCYDTAYPCASPVADPSGGSALTLTPASTVAFTTTATQLTYNWQGSPGGTGATLTVTPVGGGSSISVTVDGNTGYVQ
jgi:MSHA pilin protein MshC